MFWRINDPISEFGVGVSACRPQFCSTAIRLRRCRRGLRKKHGHAHARIKNQRGKRFDRLAHAWATDILPDSQSHYLKLCERTLNVRGFPCGKRVRWLGWSPLTDFTQPHGISTRANVERI